MLQHFLDLVPEIIDFLESRNEEYEQLSEDSWLLDLGFLKDLTEKLNRLNCELKGKYRNTHMISAVNVFKVKLGLWTSQLRNWRLTHFPNLENVSQNIEDKNAFHPEQFYADLNKLASEFAWRFQEVNQMEKVVAFISIPFLSLTLKSCQLKCRGLLYQRELTWRCLIYKVTLS